MAKTSLQIKAKNAATEASITTTLPYVNPEANSATLKSFALKLNGLTTNNYDEANRVQSINVDTEDTPKQNGSIAFVSNPPQFTKYAQTIQIQADQLIINGETSTTFPAGIEIFGQATLGGVAYGIRTANNQLIIDTINAVPTGTYNIQITIPETDKYTAATATATITVS